MSDVSNTRGPNPKGQREKNAAWDATTSRPYWCACCKTHLVEGPWSLCPTCVDKGCELPPPENARPLWRTTMLHAVLIHTSHWAVAVPFLFTTGLRRNR